MTLKSKFTIEMKKALKSGEKLRLSVIRLLLSLIKNKEIQKGKELSDLEIIEVISSSVKQRKESIKQFNEGGRNDLAEKEEAELKILQSFLPEPLSKDEIEKIIEAAIKETEAISIRDMGKVMKIIMPQLIGQADGQMVNQLVKAKLQS